MGIKNSNIEIIRLSKDHSLNYFKEIAELHISQIPHGAIRLLGPTLLSKIYYELSKAPKAGVWIAIENKKVLGFLTGCSDIRKTFKYLILKLWFHLISYAFCSFLEFNILKLIAILKYPFNTSLSISHKFQDCKSVKAEILSLVISPEIRKSGFGRKLVQAFEHSLQSWNVPGYYRVSSDLSETNSNAFYQKAGFLPCHQVKLNNLILQVYLMKIDQLAELKR